MLTGSEPYSAARLRDCCDCGWQSSLPSHTITQPLAHRSFQVATVATNWSGNAVAAAGVCGFPWWLLGRWKAACSELRLEVAVVLVCLSRLFLVWVWLL